MPDTIEMVAWESLEHIAWQDRTRIRFVDRTGQFAALVRTLKVIQDREHTAALNILSNEGYRRRFWRTVKYGISGSKVRLLRRGRKLVLRRIRSPQDAELRYESNAAPVFLEADSVNRADEIRAVLKRADRWDFYIVPDFVS